MVASINMIRGCDHIVTEKKKEYTEVKMTRNLIVGYPDQFRANINVIRVDGIHFNEAELSKGINYTQSVSNNIIEWSDEKNNPKPGEEYLVLGLFEFIKTGQYEDSECPRCGGNGWYADLINNMDRVSGIDKMAQDMIKILFTNKNFEGAYGSSIKDALAENVYDESVLIQKVSSSIDDCATQIKAMQGSLMSEGYELESNELLNSIDVVNVIFVREETTCYISLKITNMAGENINFSFKV